MSLERERGGRKLKETGGRFIYFPRETFFNKYMCYDLNFFHFNNKLTTASFFGVL